MKASAQRRRDKKLKQKLAKGTISRSSLGSDDVARLYGADALAQVVLTSNDDASRLTLQAVQNALLWSLTSDQGELPRWMMVSRKPLLRGALLVLASSGDIASLSGGPDDFTPPCSIVLPSAHHSRAASAAASELLQVKLPKKRRRVAEEAVPAADPGLHRGRLPRSGRWRLSYVHSFTPSGGELRENGYPLSGDPACAMYSDTLCAEGAAGAGEAGEEGGGEGEDVEAAARLLGLDCEMCVVAGGRQQLSRVCVVDESGGVLLDELVIPEEPIVDYVTEYSGVTQSMLADATYTRSDAARAVAALVGASGAARRTFLVGHSLESDLHALRLKLPQSSHAMAADGGADGGDAGGARPLREPPVQVLDTALLFPLRCREHGPPAKAALRNLTVRHLGREIQQATGPGGSGGGHSPAEDAIAALDLARLKLEKGHAFGVPGAAWGGAYEPLHEALFRARVRCDAIDRTEQLWRWRAPRETAATPPSEPGGESDARVLAAGVEGVAPSGSAGAPAVRMTNCDGDDAAVDAALRVASAADGGGGAHPFFIWLGLREATAGRMRRLGAGLPRNTLVVAVGTGGRDVGEGGGSGRDGCVVLGVSSGPGAREEEGEHPGRAGPGLHEPRS